MNQLKFLEWLALQRRFVGSPKKGLEIIQAGNIEFDFLERGLAKKDFKRCEELHLKIIPYDSNDYPALLKQIYDPPLVLLAKGSLEIWKERPWVAVVGARKASLWGLQKTKEIVSSLTEKGFGIVSGLAYGIDAMAHQASLQKGGVTLSVLGSGLDRIYPERNYKLAQEIEKQGCLLSEFPLGTPPYKSHFPQRNRIISGLSHAVLVIEAGKQSGSLITARFALEQGREVFVLPPPDEEDHRYDGNRRLLEEGAEAYENAEQVGEGIQTLLDPSTPRPCSGQASLRAGHGPGTLRQSSGQAREQGPRKKEEYRKTVHCSNPLLSFLKKPRSLDYLIKETNKVVSTILSELVQLESQGLVKKLPGPLWQSL